MLLCLCTKSRSVLPVVGLHDGTWCTWNVIITRLILATRLVFETRLLLARIRVLIIIIIKNVKIRVTLS